MSFQTRDNLRSRHSRTRVLGIIAARKSQSANFSEREVNIMKYVIFCSSPNFDQYSCSQNAENLRLLSSKASVARTPIPFVPASLILVRKSNLYNPLQFSLESVIFIFPMQILYEPTEASRFLKLYLHFKCLLENSCSEV